MRGGWLARALALVLLVLAAVLQTTLVAPLPLPGGRPDLVLLVVLALALVGGRGAGAIAGFAGGLLTDLSSAQPLGTAALVLCVVGYLAGMAGRELAGSIALALAAVALATVLALVGEGLVLGVVGDASLQWPVLLRELPTSVLYDVLLAPPLLAAVARLHRRLHPVAVATASYPSIPRQTRRTARQQVLR